MNFPSNRFIISLLKGFLFWFALGRLGFANALVFQFGDTIRFYKDEKLITEWILKDSLGENDSYYSLEKAKISPDNRFLLIYEEKSSGTDDSIFSRLTLYNAATRKVWSRKKIGKTKISFELTSIFDDMVLIFYTDRHNGFPVIEMIKMNCKSRTIDLRQWDIIIKYAISANRRYMLFHSKKPFNNRLWDYVYFIDLKTNKDWEYLFPNCFSCKRGWIELTVDNEGKCEVVQNKEYRIFSKEGNLLDIFVRIE